MIERKDFITVTARGVSVGNQITTKYHGYDITDVDKLPEGFHRIQREIEYLGCEQKLAEIHILSSQTLGNYKQIIDNPSPLSGQHYYIQLVFEGGIQSRWGCVGFWPSTSACIANCAQGVCVYSAGKVIDELVYDLFPSLRYKIEKDALAMYAASKNRDPQKLGMGILDPEFFKKLSREEMVDFFMKWVDAYVEPGK